MSTSTSNQENLEQREDVLRLAESILENYKSKKPFNKHAEYKNFKLNDAKYLDALSLLNNPADVIEIVKKFAVHYQIALNNRECHDMFNLLASNGQQTKKIKVLDSKTTSFYLGFNTKEPEVFLSPDIYKSFNYDLKCGLLMNYYIKHGILLDAPRSYNSYVTLNSAHAHLIHNILTNTEKTQDFYKKLSTIIYTKNLTDIPNHYMKNVLEHVDPTTLSTRQKAQYIRNIYKYALRHEGEEPCLNEQLIDMEKYCGVLQEWPAIKKQITTLNDLADVTFMHLDTVLALLMPKEVTSDLPEIVFNC